MTDAEKQTECEKICGPFYSKESGMHSSAPIRCPILDDQWKNPKRKVQG